jgi:hypothetical protein
MESVKTQKDAHPGITSNTEDAQPTETQQSTIHPT